MYLLSTFLSTLDRLSLTHCTIAVPFPDMEFPSITKLELYNVECSDNMLMLVARNSPQLLNLTIVRSHTLTISGMEVLSRCCKQLHNVTLSHLRCTDGMVVPIVSANKLRSIILDGDDELPNEITHTTIKAIVDNSEALHTLQMRFCPRVQSVEKYNYSSSYSPP